MASMRAGFVLLSAVALSVPSWAFAEDRHLPLVIEGDVTEPDGKPIANALVTLGCPGAIDPFHPDTLSGPVETDPAGAFRIKARPASIHHVTQAAIGSTYLRVQAPGFVAVGVYVHRDREGPLRWSGLWEQRFGSRVALTLPRPAGVFRGVVIDAETRAPVNGARVIVGADGEAATDAQGRFEIPLRQGCHAVTLAVEEYRSTITFVEIDRGDVEKTLSLRYGQRTLKVGVADASGQPVPSPWIVVANDEDGNVERHLKGDTNGVVAVQRLSAGRYSVLAYSLDHGFGVQRGVQADGGQLTISLVPARRVKLSLIKESDRPLANREVLCVLTRLGEWTIGSLSLHGRPGGVLVSSSASTNAEGEVDLVVPAGLAEIAVGLPNATGVVVLDAATKTDAVIPVRLRAD